MKCNWEDIEGFPAGRKTSLILFSPDYNRATVRIISLAIVSYATVLALALIFSEGGRLLATETWLVFHFGIVLVPGIIWHRATGTLMRTPDRPRLEKTFAAAASTICAFEHNRVITAEEQQELWELYCDTVSSATSKVSAESHALREEDVDKKLTILADKFEDYTERKPSPSLT